MAADYKLNQLFAKYGHECNIENELDETPNFFPGKTCYARVQRTLMRFRMISETNKRCNRYLRSQGAIAFEKYRHLKQNSYMIHPFSDARKYIECFMCLIFLIQFVMVPLDIAYFGKPPSSTDLYTSAPWKTVRLLTDCFCFTDVWLNYLTGYFNEHKKQSEMSPKKVALKYFSSKFFIDLISSIPTNIDLLINISNEQTISTLQIFSCLKLLRFNTFLKYSRNIEESYNISYCYFNIAMIIIITFTYYHIVTCSVMLIKIYNVGKVYTHRNTTYKHEFLYYSCFYKSLLMTRISGYSIKTKFSGELLFQILIWIASKILFIFLIGKIMQILRAKTSSTQKYVQMVRQLKQYMCHRQLPQYMQKRLLTYYEFRFQRRYFRESEILSTISGQLRQEIVMHSCRKLVENVAFFNNIPFTLLVRIVSCLRYEIFLVNDVIVKAATSGNSMFFIASGTVAVYTSSGKEICHLEDGAHFGEIALVMRDELRVASVVAVDVCELYRLDRKEFDRAIHPYPDLLDNIQRIAADRMERTNMLDEFDRREMASKRLY